MYHLILAIFVLYREWVKLVIVSACFYEHSYCSDILLSLSSDKCTYCKSLWIKASAKCPKCKLLCV